MLGKEHLLQLYYVLRELVSRLQEIFTPMHAKAVYLIYTTLVGTGKTFLTSKAIDHIKQSLESSPQHNEGFAFFFIATDLDRQCKIRLLF